MRDLAGTRIRHELQGQDGMTYKVKLSSCPQHKALVDEGNGVKEGKVGKAQRQGDQRTSIQ